jgi:hypothetical protein
MLEVVGEFELINLKVDMMNKDCDVRFVFSNGAFKSGSTWVYSMLNEMLDPTEVQSSDVCHNRKHWMASVYFPRMIRRGNCEGLYVVKSHLYTRYHLKNVLGIKNARYVNICRDVKDAVVSAYYHYNRGRKDKLSFEEYYWKVGRYKAYEIFVYDRVWEKMAGDSRVHLMRYEDLKQDFDKEVNALAAFLEVEMSSDLLEKIRSGTSIESLRKSWKEDSKDESERFFRKGIVGDWKNHFTDEALQDLSKIESNGLGVFGMCIFKFLFLYRRNIQYYIFSNK